MHLAVWPPDALRPTSPINVLKQFLQQYHGRPLYLFKVRRWYSANSELFQRQVEDSKDVENVAIIGGGITGLATAYFLSKTSPKIRITLLEGGKRLGGWLHSEVVETSHGKVIFEKGPRTLRPNIPNGVLTLDLIQDLGIQHKILATSKNSVAAQNRYVYYPDHLVRMPGPGMSVFEAFSTIFNEPAFDGLFSAIMYDLLVPRRGLPPSDESIASFFARRRSSKVAENLVSAVLHGIYAGDIEKLSMRSILPSLSEFERSSGSVNRGMRAARQTARFSAHDQRMLGELGERPLSDTMKTIEASSVYTLKGGLGELAHELEASLVQNPMVRIRRETLVKDLRLDKEADGQVRLSTRSSEQYSESKETHHLFSHVVSTITARTLHQVVRNENGNRMLYPFDEIPSVSVMVVNFFYSDPSILPVHGFGYLIPRSVPFEQNPERALGVVFDSDATIGLDDVPGTKVTVMLGGHWWDDWDAFPDEHEGAKMAKAVLRRHLGIIVEPDATRVSLQHNCIPQYTVGHRDRLEQGSRLLESFKGRLRVAGNSYTGVGLNDCVRSAREVVRGLFNKEEKTGLQWFFHPTISVKLADIPTKWRRQGPATEA